MMDFLPGVCEPGDMVFLGVGEYAASYIGEGYETIHGEEDIDDYAHAVCICLVVDGVSLTDLSLLDRTLDRCKAEEVFVIVLNHALPELIKVMRHKLSCVMTVGGEDVSDGVLSLMELVAHMNTGERLLELDTAELRALFDPASTVVQHSFSYNGIDPARLSRDVKALAMTQNVWPTLVCVFLSPGLEDTAQLDDLIAPLLALMPEGGHRPMLWNVYRSNTLAQGQVRVEILRAKPAPGTMETLRDANLQLS
ncbi:MAG: hypothetical protein ACERKO_07815 [Acetanaerobacterium sp.]